MNMVSSQPRIPCRFVVIKYADDLVRDEPVNVGIMLQSKTTHETLFRSVATHTNWGSRNSRIENTTMMLEMVKRMEEDINSEKNNIEIIHKISSKYDSRFRFSEPRGTLPLDMEEEIRALFEKYVTVKIEKSESEQMIRGGFLYRPLNSPSEREEKTIHMNTTRPVPVWASIEEHSATLAARPNGAYR